MTMQPRWTEPETEAFIIGLPGSGYGRIARALARRAAGFGLRLEQHHPRRREGDELDRWVSFDELLRTSDVVSVHTPLTAETKGMIGAAELALMKPTATLVNTGRGGVADEGALLTAPRRGYLHSAGLDVLTDEPRTDRATPCSTNRTWWHSHTRARQPRRPTLPWWNSPPATSRQCLPATPHPPCSPAPRAVSEQLTRRR
ncbi:NAD(P)-dependent oxidoreductase [Streptomyces viridochromogenes]|uniref:NAD(P)-dependent oxidoreductase n=1 Tax=Streptomyces viridochromogenes TaxID=1938 RepID=UPI001F309723|nr:NAD(P)-dependent oxidoreductase [Streptomyces viridochromogenes]